MIAALPLVHSTYRRWYAVLQLDPAKVFPATGLIVEMLCRQPDDLLKMRGTFAASGTLVRNRLVTLGGNPDEPAAVSPVLVEDRVLRYLLGDDALDDRFESVASLVALRDRTLSLSLTDATAVRLELLPASEPRSRLACWPACA